eukprot:6417971-Alexandrium_andersonii.AAC.1
MRCYPRGAGRMMPDCARAPRAAVFSQPHRNGGPLARGELLEALLYIRCYPRGAGRMMPLPALKQSK